MKKMIFILPLLLAFACATQANASNDGFTINLRIKNLPDCEITVSENIPDSKTFYIDTLFVKRGKAKYYGKVDYPQLLTFSFSTKEDDYIGSMNIFVSNTENILVKGESLKKYQIIGQNVCKEYVESEKRLKPLFKEYYRLTNEENIAYDSKLMIIADSLAKRKEEAFNHIYNAVTNHPEYANSLISPYYIYKYFEKDIKQLEDALNKLSPALNDNGYVKQAKEELTQKKGTQIGQKAYNFLLNDIDEKKYQLSDYQGKYVLIEFSASWCSWCKKEIPFLKKMYEEHKDNDQFAMFTINLDNKREKWVNDVKKLNLLWPVISDLKAFKGKVAKAYNIHGIPMIYLIDPQGNIIEKSLRGEEMLETVRKYLKKKSPEKEFDFTIEGTVEDIKEGVASLYDEDEIICQKEFTDGKYTLTGHLKENKSCVVFISRPGKNYADAMYALYMQPGTLKAETYCYRNLHQTRFSNAPIQSLINRIEDEMSGLPDYKAYQQKSIDIQKEYKKHSSAPKELENLRSEYLFKAMNQMFKQEDNEYQEALGKVMSQYSSILSDQHKKQLYERLTPAAQKTLTVRAMIEGMKRENEVSVGKLAPDFKAQDLAGKDYLLHLFRGKYVFLEFSASWCGWCKKEIPYIKEAYQELKDKNIVFVTVMMDDKKEHWEKDVKKFQIPWLSLSELKGVKRSEIARKYNISGVPVSFLINPDGEIIEKNLRGDNVLKTLKKYVQ